MSEAISIYMIVGSYTRVLQGGVFMASKVHWRCWGSHSFGQIYIRVHQSSVCLAHSANYLKWHIHPTVATTQFSGGNSLNAHWHIGRSVHAHCVTPQSQWILRIFWKCVNGCSFRAHTVVTPQSQCILSTFWKKLYAIMESLWTS